MAPWVDAAAQCSGVYKSKAKLYPSGFSCVKYFYYDPFYSCEDFDCYFSIIAEDLGKIKI